MSSPPSSPWRRWPSPSRPTVAWALARAWVRRSGPRPTPGCGGTRCGPGACPPSARRQRVSRAVRGVWTDEVDDILAGDLVAALAYLTSAGGAVATPVCPLGLHDRDRCTVGFTTSTGYGRKLARIAADGRVAMAFHTRTHGRTNQPGFVLVRGEASVDTTGAALARVVAQASLHLGPLATGWFWNRWLRVYYQDRVVVWIRVRRITVRAADGTLKQVIGAPLTDLAPPVQRPPRNGSGPRVDARRAGLQVAQQPNRLLAYREADGYPAVVPVDVLAAKSDGLILRPA